MTLLADLNAMTLTATAKATVSAKGADLGSMVASAKTHTIELTNILKFIQSAHPTGGADTANYAALGVVIAELA